MPEEFIECAVCGRNLLRGERVAEYATPDREIVKICPLCRPAAETSGWIPAELAASVPQAERARRRGLRKRISRASGAARERLVARREAPAPENAEPPPPKPHRERAAPKAERERPAAKPGRRRKSAPEKPKRRSPERVMRAAINRFNSGSERRVVAGLIRSLGEPRASVRAGDGGSAFVTVAWELSWYQWEIPANGDGTVREAGKGREVSELAEHDRSWNASVEPDGTVTLSTTRMREPAAGA